MQQKNNSDAFKKEKCLPRESCSHLFMLAADYPTSKESQITKCSEVGSVPKRIKVCAAKMKRNNVLLCFASANAAQLYGIVSE